jgi:ADP-heptose:LPS heptosyltransferase
MDFLFMRIQNCFNSRDSVRIIIFRALQLGDLLCSVPALRALRKSFPSAHITLASLPWARSFVDRFRHYLDGFLEFPGYPGLPEKAPEIEKIPEFFVRAQRQKFDLAIQMHGSGSYVNSIVSLLGARRTAGFYLEKEYCPDPDLFMIYPAGEHEILQQLRLMEFLGIPAQGEDLEFPLTPKDREEFYAISENLRPKTENYICIHPGARFLSRRWMPERFAKVADALSDYGYEIVITGTDSEKELAGQLCHFMKSPALNLTGVTTLGALGCLLEGSRLLLSNDTGISHLAAALKTPSVVLVLGSDPKRWAPLNGRRHKALYHPVECRPCLFQECPIHLPCGTSIQESEVFESVLNLLAEKELRAV